MFDLIMDVLEPEMVQPAPWDMLFCKRYSRDRHHQGGSRAQAGEMEDREKINRKKPECMVTSVEAAGENVVLLSEKLRKELIPPNN